MKDSGIGNQIPIPDSLNDPYKIERATGGQQLNPGAFVPPEEFN
jgi:hypothetical protein